LLIAGVAAPRAASVWQGEEPGGLTMGSRSAKARVRAVGGFLAVCLAVCGACSRERYYRQADREVQSLVAEKSLDPRWSSPSPYSVVMDARSRFYDPHDMVRPPIPEDDPTSHQYMHCVDGMRGYRRWHADGDRPELESPYWREYLRDYAQVDDKGRVILTLPSALQVARINAPDWQDQLETVYLTALDVSTERFRFDVQFFGGNDTTFTHLGRMWTGSLTNRTSAPSERNTLSTVTDLEMRRRFATAGELLVGFANSFVWQFAGPNTNSAVSLLDFTLTQPLLRGAGRAVALEQLTISERALLANLRALQRYRQGFFTKVAVGELGVSGLQRRGGFFGGTGLTGFTGTGSGGIGGVASSTGFGVGGGGGGGTGGAATGFVGGGAGTVGGYVGLLQQEQQIHNNEENLASQQRVLRLLEAHLQAGTIDLVQVDQFRQNIETSRATLLQSRNSLEDGLDRYRTGTLGLPPDLPLILDTSMTRQFQFIDPQIMHLQNRLSDFRSEFGEQPAEPPLDVLQRALARLAKLRDEAGRQVASVATDLQRLEEAVPRRQTGMTPDDGKQLAADLQKLKENHAELQQRLDGTGPRLTQLTSEAAADTRRATADRLVELGAAVAAVVDELSLVQARSRMEAITLQHETLSSEDALAIARGNRLDWMNNRAALVDTWRLITYNANALESYLNLTFSGDMTTRGDNPVKFQAPTGDLKVGLQFDAPFTRLLERNNFRQVLIDYQRDRRRLIQFEDSVHQTLRQLLRDLEQLSVNLEIQRRAVTIAIRRVDQTREVLNEPPPPPQPGQATVQLGPTAALNLLTALNDLQSSQNNFMSVWLNYYATRMKLARELGIMQLDENGVWVEGPLGAAERATDADAAIPPAVSEQWLRALESGPPLSSPQASPAADPPPSPPARARMSG
jgi:hypothetical protein